jgi:type IV pilus assembly protein PilV
MNMHRPQAGFGIVEVMVALVVLAVGMLGIASLYVTSLQSSGSAISRMQAVNLAGDLADRIRANRFARNAYTQPEAEHVCSGVTDCSQEDMAANDLFTWRKQVRALLPGNATGIVAYTPAAGDVPDDYTITVSWKEANRGKGQDAGDTDADSTNGSQLNYILRMQIEP